MPILYDWPLEWKSLQLPQSKRITLFKDHTLTLPIFWSQNWTEEVGTDLTWGAGTKLQSARIEIDSEQGLEGLNFVFKMNRAEIIKITDWQGPVHKVLDITGILPKGRNTFQAGVWTRTPMPFETSIVFTATLAIEFQGEEPYVTPPTPEETWKEVIKILGIGGIVVGIGYVVVRGLAEARRYKRE